jgi:hypothetical protein
MNQEDKDEIKKMYLVIKEILMGIEDLFDENEIIEMQPYIKNDLMQLLIHNKIDSKHVQEYINDVLASMGILEARPTLAKEISDKLMNP